MVPIRPPLHPSIQCTNRSAWFESRRFLKWVWGISFNTQQPLTALSLSVASLRLRFMAFRWSWSCLDLFGPSEYWWFWRLILHLLCGCCCCWGLSASTSKKLNSSLLANLDSCRSATEPNAFLPLLALSSAAGRTDVNLNAGCFSFAAAPQPLQPPDNKRQRFEWKQAASRP